MASIRQINNGQPEKNYNLISRKKYLVVILSSLKKKITAC